MQTLTELLRHETSLHVDEVEHLDRLLASWQLLADLSFADLLLWCPLKDESGFVCLAQMRPYTSQTLYPHDLVGKLLRPEELAVVDRVYSENRSWRSENPVIIDGLPIRIEAIPVPVGDRVTAVMTIHSAPLKNRRRGELEQNYLECAAVLARMVAQGIFPFGGEALDPELAPRVGDGIIRLNMLGKVMYASPNAVSAFRRLGVVSNIQGEKLSDVGVDASAATLALATGQPAQIDVEVGASVMLQRALPFLEGRDRRVTGALVLVRDVTQLRYRERQLQRQQAVIREVHHRVKNNLQTIASLLRLQGRRVPAEARRELEEATRRIAAIALVHETLSRESSQKVDFAGVAGRLIRMVSEGLLHPDGRVTIRLEGDPGKLHSDLATPLAVIMVELLQNAVEHAFADRSGKVLVTMARRDNRLLMTVKDDGIGLPEDTGTMNRGLGLQIVSALVESELGGSFSYNSDGGACFSVDVPTERPAGMLPVAGS
ncbi:MAG TPA: sensor histidine kinase [Actinomycetota bacterium]|nr:sensor histidine kinase [Actinomycetota bacterium]